jgi:hypothetical protein
MMLAVTGHHKNMADKHQNEKYSDSSSITYAKYRQQKQQEQRNQTTGNVKKPMIYLTHNLL